MFKGKQWRTALLLCAMILSSEAISISSISRATAENAEKLTAQQAQADAVVETGLLQSESQNPNPKKLESVTQVKSQDGTVMSTTRVLTDDLENGTAITHVTHQDGDAAPYTTDVVTAYPGDVRHEAMHKRTDENGYKKAIVIMDHDVSVGTEDGTNTTTPDDEDSDGQWVPMSEKELNQVYNLVDKVQEMLNTANYVWAICLLFTFFGFLFIFPSMEQYRNSGTMAWTFWTSLVVLLLYINVMGTQIIGVHKFLKFMVVWGANFYIEFHNHVKEKMQRIQEKSGVDLSRFADAITAIHHSASSPSFQSDVEKQVRERAATTLLGLTPQQVIDKVTNVPYAALPNNAENMCVDAWVGSSTAKMVDGVLRYSTEGPIETWSPVARWNLRRAPHEKKIPNPSECSYELGSEPDYHTCPGYRLFREGADDYCDCMEVLVELGYQMEVSTLMGCIMSRRDTIFTVLAKMLRSDQDKGAERAAAVAGAEGCTGTYDGSSASIAGSASVVSYKTNSYVDASEQFWVDESLVSLQAGGSAAWKLSECTPIEVGFEFRYAAASDVSVTMTYDSTALAFEDGSSTLKATGGDLVFARANAVIPSREISLGDHEIKIVSSGDLKIHRLVACSSYEQGGCPVSASDEAYCYTAVDNQKFDDGVTGFGSGTTYSSWNDANKACSARMDCSGVNLVNGVFSLMTGSNKSTLVGATMYKRQVGVKESAATALCLS